MYRYYIVSRFSMAVLRCVPTRCKEAFGMLDVVSVLSTLKRAAWTEKVREKDKAMTSERERQKEGENHRELFRISMGSIGLFGR